MTETINGLKRTNYCGDLRKDDFNKEIILTGWVQRRRPLGGLIFITLRDRTGIIQLVFNEEKNKTLFDKAYNLRNEFIIGVKGVVKLREDNAKNDNMETGDIEIEVSELRVLSQAENTPFEILDNITTSEEVRLKYRYLDLRRPEMQKNLIFRHNAVRAAREFFYENNFIEIDTPMLMKPTPEGARDYLVPSRLHEGKFYALPQSPQLYKQLLMLSGFDRYFQFARCFRDEDLRADRQPEFTQIDFEMSFVEVDDVLDINQKFLQYLFKKTLNYDVELPIQRMPYREAMSRFGSDKPDLRFGFEIIDISNNVANCDFSVFTNAVSNGGSVRAINVKGYADKFSRKAIDSLTEFVRGIRASGIAWCKNVNNEISCSFNKFMNQETLDDIYKQTNFENGDLLLIIADQKNSIVLSSLGALRVEIAKRLELVNKNEFKFVLITEFPFLDFDEENNEYVAMHHPFTSPMIEDLEYIETDPSRVRAKAYDVVLNGVELGSGSIRISDPELQSKMFDLIGLTKEDANEKFGFLIDAFKYGAPPHGGFAFGVDRLMMLMVGATSLRDVIAFPKVQNASELMTNSPTNVDNSQLNELNISIKK
ncbi:MAG: aspartate--tRNA ligase [Clostridia bacterium]